MKNSLTSELIFEMVPVNEDQKSIILLECLDKCVSCGMTYCNPCVAADSRLGRKHSCACSYPFQRKVVTSSQHTVYFSLLLS